MTDKTKEESMNKTKIDWCDMSWNPITGCLKGCDYCYAMGITRRFGGTIDTCPDSTLHILDEPYYADQPGQEDGTSRVCHYPWMFDPTFHRYRLDDPMRIKNPKTIFVCSLADMFGQWIPDDWITQVLNSCATAHWHRYLFLTKNPSRYRSVIEYVDSIGFLPSDSGLDAYFGATAATTEQLYAAYESQANWLCIEPMLEDMAIDFEDCVAGDGYYNSSSSARWDWVVLGAETGNLKGKVIPKREWIQRIVEVSKLWEIPVYMKRNLAKVWGEPLIQEFPWKGKETKV